MKSHVLFLLLLSVFVIATPGKSYPGGDDTVATIGPDCAITFAQVAKTVRDKFYDRMYDRKPFGFAYKKALDDMIIQQMKRLDFIALGLQNDEALLAHNRRVISEELAIAYYNTQIVRKYVNETTVRATYERMKHELVCRVFVIDTTGLARTKKGGTVRSFAGRLDAARRRGASYESLVAACRAWIQAPLAPEDTETVSWRRSLNDESAAIMFALAPGQSTVFLTPTGLTVAKAMRTTPVTVEPFTKMKDEIVSALAISSTQESQDEYNRLKTSLVNDKGMHWNAAAIKTLLRWSNIPGFYAGPYVDTLERVLAGGVNPVIMRYKGGVVDLKEYLRLVRDVLTLPDKGTFTAGDIKSVITEALRLDRLVRMARSLGLEQSVFNPHSTDPTLKERIVRLYNQKEIEEKIPALTEQAQKQFYAANKDSLYYQLAKVNIYAVIDSIPARIEAMKEKLAAGTPFQKLAPVIDVKTYIRKKDGTLATYFGDEPPYLAEAAMKLVLNQVAGPIEFQDEMGKTKVALIKAVGVREEKQLSFEEALATMGQDFVKYQREKLEASVEKSLRAKYSASVRETALDRMLLQSRAPVN